MTTHNCSTVKFALAKFYCRGVSNKKQHFWTICLSAPKGGLPPPSKTRIYLRCSAVNFGGLSSFYSKILGLLPQGGRGFDQFCRQSFFYGHLGFSEVVLGLSFYGQPTSIT